jgi:hypothetical protein
MKKLWLHSISLRSKDSSSLLPHFSTNSRRRLLMRKALIISPFAGKVERNRAYLAQCFYYCFEKGYAPFAPHAMYPHYLDDQIPSHRALGMDSGLAWGQEADIILVFFDYGISEGMKLELTSYRCDPLRRAHCPIHYIKLFRK